jgi:hypothetical protein
MPLFQKLRKTQINVKHVVMSMEHDASTLAYGQCLKLQQEIIIGHPYTGLKTILEPQ